NGDGTLNSPITVDLTGAKYTRPVIGDFNNDGIPDIATTAVNATGYDTAVYLGNGDGTFAAPIHTGTPAESFLVGDFDGDGNLDLATMSCDCSESGEGFGQVVIQWGDGTGHFPAVSAPVQLWEGLPAGAADFDHDGRTDL